MKAEYTPWGCVYEGSSTWCIGQETDPQEGPPNIRIWDRNDDRARANAQLIVAARNACMEINPENPIAVAEALPELLEALRRSLNFMNSLSGPGHQGAAQQVRTAINKAMATN